jgi:hypothetical protein
MKKINIYYIITAISLIAITSCTKVINLDLGNNTGELVIEGNITNVSGPQYVMLSTNVPFTNTNVYPPVTGAVVTIKDQIGKSYTLTEGPKGTYSITPLVGVTGNTYTLSVVSGNKTYTASSTMPTAIALDSLTSKNNVINSGSNIKKTITVYYQDPAGVPNQYRFVMYVNGVQIKSVFAYNDLFTDGRHVSSDLRQNDVDIHQGDTVKVEMQCIDTNIFTYWYTLMSQQQQGAGVAPSDPPSNISPTTLGYFSAHTTQTRTIVVK